MASQPLPRRIMDPQIQSSVVEERMTINLSRKEWDLYKMISYQTI